MEGDTFGRLIPDFEYYLVPLHKYSNEELLAKKDEISFVMMINRMQNAEDIEEFRKLPGYKVDEMLKDTPEHILDIISNVLRAFLLKLNLPEEETEELVGKVKEKKMGNLFENMEKMDIQAERRNTAEARQQAEEAQECAEKERMRAELAEEKVIQTTIETYQEMDAAKDDVLQKIQVKFNLSKEQAMEKMALYWKNDK